MAEPKSGQTPGEVRPPARNLSRLRAERIQILCHGDADLAAGGLPVPIPCISLSASAVTVHG
jgi:hypothetical protein